MERRLIPTVCAVLLFFLGPPLAVGQQKEAPKPKVSSNSLTAEQVAVYRALLEDFQDGTNSVINLANTTMPLKSSERACLAGSIYRMESSVPIVHQLNSAILNSGRFVLVDTDRQEEMARASDLPSLPDSVFDVPIVPFTKQVDDSRKRVFDALSHLTLSEIAFDKHHRRAVVAYAFVCPGLCGHGSILILKRAGQKWKITKRCGQWFS
jgi:hypothetical protein